MFFIIKGFSQPQNGMCRKTVESIWFYSSVQRSVFACDHSWCYAKHKHTSNILKFMLLHFKKLVVIPETHPLGTSRSPTQEEKRKTNQEHERRVVLEAHKKVLSVQLLCTGISYQLVLLGLSCTTVSHQGWNTLFYSAQMTTWNNLLLYSRACFYFCPPPAVKA